MHPTMQQQIDTHKSYEIHVKRLSSIREGRKTALQSGSNRPRSNSMHIHQPYSYNNKYAYNHQLPYAQHKQIRDKKHSTFINTYNQKQQKICEANIKLFEKLTKQKHRKSTKNNCYNYYRNGNPNMTERQTINYSTQFSINNAFNGVGRNSRISFQKMQAQKTKQLEDQKLKTKINNYKSSLSHKRFGSSEKDRQKLKNRLLRYTENRQLKSATYIKPYTVKTVSLQQKNPYRTLQQSFQSKPISNKPKIASFYNAQAIKKNRIENYGIRSSGRSDKKSQRSNVRLSQRGQSIKYDSRSKSFFKTNIQ